MIMKQYYVVCDTCGEESLALTVKPQPSLTAARLIRKDFVAYLKVTKKWLFKGNGRHECPKCRNFHKTETSWRSACRSGFTLLELLAVLTIVSIIAAVTVPVVFEAVNKNAVGNAASAVHGELAAAVARAQRDGVAGVRLVPDPGFPVGRLADGSVDPTAPLAFSKIVPLVQPGGIGSGLVSIRDSFPPTFPAYGTKALVLEQEVARDEGGVRFLNEPTSWAWMVRLGDRVELANRTYTVCGPMAEFNAEGFVNYGPGVGTGLDRGDGWAEWLLLVNGIDDDGDGWVDNGWDGRDENQDGVVDDAAEWTEVEAWGLNSPVLSSPYLIRPRPAPASNGQGVELAAAVVDATAWSSPPIKADGSVDPAVRSRLPVDRFSGTVDLLVRPDGRVEPVGRYAPTVPAVGLLAKPYLHFWVCDRGSVGSPTPEAGRLVSVNARTGLTGGGDADPADPAGSFRSAEGGGL